MSSSEKEINGNLSSTPLEDLNTHTDREYELKQEWLDAKRQEEAAKADLIQHNNNNSHQQQPKQKNNGLKYCNSSKTRDNSKDPLENIGEEEHDHASDVEHTPYNDENNNSHTIHTPQSGSRKSRTSPFLSKLRNWLRYRSPT